MVVKEGIQRGLRTRSGGERTRGRKGSENAEIKIYVYYNLTCLKTINFFLAAPESNSSNGSGWNEMVS